MVAVLPSTILIKDKIYDMLKFLGHIIYPSPVLYYRDESHLFHIVHHPQLLLLIF